MPMRTEKNVEEKYQTQHAKKRCVWKTFDIFYAETLNGQQKHSCCFLKHWF
jgi:hypothetical protein